MERDSKLDYSDSGLTIQYALLAKYEGGRPRGTRDLAEETPWLNWGGRRVRTPKSALCPGWRTPGRWSTRLWDREYHAHIVSRHVIRSARIGPRLFEVFRGPVYRRD